jgi:lambda family phage minor tail protein L
MAIPVSDLQSAAPSAIIELFELELNAAQHGVAETYRFHAGSSLNNNGQLVWAGQSYLRFPVEADGFEYSGNGQLPRPKIRCSNIMGTITALLDSLPEGLEGAKVTRVRTLARYIDGANFPGGVNPYGTPDPTAEFPREIYYVDRKVVETRDVVEFELAAAFDLAGVRAPKRQCISSICQWTYRSAECGYSGKPIADANDRPLPSVTLSAQAMAFYSAEATLTTATATLTTARNNLNAATNALNIAQGQWVLAETRYDSNNLIQYSTFGGGEIIKWNGVNVTLGSEYRLGPLRAGGNNIVYSYAIQRWVFDNSQVATAQANYNSTLATYDTALSSYNTALAARNTAFNTWQVSPQFANDIKASGDECGKRLNSCELRFGADAELPFGSFPGVGTFYA